MFCPGMPGAGKTIISSVVIDHLSRAYQEDRKIGISYIYLNYQRHNDQKIDDLLATLMKQLARQCLPLSGSVKKHLDSYKKGKTRPSVEEISKALQFIAEKFSRIFVIVNALNKCETSCRLRLMSELLKLQKHHSVNIFATSRFIPEIEKDFEDSPSLEIRAVDEDVRIYLESHMNQLRPFVQENHRLKEDIKSSISDAVDGMFLLAHIYLRFLDDKLTTNEIRDSLKTFQKQDLGSSEAQKTEVLGHAYDRVMERIQQQRGGLKEMAFKVLSWIICAKRPLSVPELQHALAIKEGKFWLDKGDLPHIGDMASVCLGLITIDEGSNIVRLVHYTTQEYFTRNWENWISNARIEIARSCITYLSFETFEAGACLNRVDLDERLQSYSLYGYSVINWGYHTRNSQVESEELALGFLQNISKVSACSEALAYLDEDFNSDTRKMTELHLTAYFGLNILTSKLLERNSTVDASDEAGYTPLFIAAEMGHGTVARLLLENKANVDQADRYDRTPLYFAAQWGHEKVVMLLLEKKANVDQHDKGGRTPLHVAADGGHEKVVMLLLENRANVDQHDKYGHTPLDLAAPRGNEKVVMLLLEKNARVNPTRGFATSPLLQAAVRGHEAVVRLLLEKKANVNPMLLLRITPLALAAKNGHERVVKLLLEHNATIDFEDQSGWTPISWATREGREKVVKLLLENGAAVDHRDHREQTPLSIASKNGHYAVAKLLLDNGATISSTDKNGETPLSMATKNGHEKVVKLLLEKQAEQKSLDTEGAQT